MGFKVGSVFLDLKVGILQHCSSTDVILKSVLPNEINKKIVGLPVTVHVRKLCSNMS